MLIKNWMSKPAITVNADETIADAVNLLQKHEICRLPVMEGERLVGIVTDQDIKHESVHEFSSLNSPNSPNHGLQKTVSEIMTISPITISNNQTIEHASEVLLYHRISGLPVISQAREVVGMITRSDLLRFILTTIGMGKEGIQFAFELIDRPGSIKEVTNLMREYGGRIGTVFSTRVRAPNGYRQAYIRTYDLDQPSLVRLKEELSEKSKILYIINERERISEIF
jgi:acetoin utilization protein AcuB